MAEQQHGQQDKELQHPIFCNMDRYKGAGEQIHDRMHTQPAEELMLAR